MKGQLILIPGRSSKQGVGLNKGKLKEEYIRVTTTLELSAEDAPREWFGNSRHRKNQ